MTFKTFVASLIHAANIIVIPTLIAIAFVAIIWGVVKYFFIEADNDESRRKGREFVLWGVLGMVLLISAWGVVYILLDTLGLNPS